MLLCSGDEDAAVAQAPEDPEDALPWVTSLKHGSYDQLDLADRLEALLWLVELVGEGPAVRGRLAAREAELVLLKKQLLEDAKVWSRRAAG
jgi:hypothetical protein